MWTRQRAALNAARAASSVLHSHEPAIPSDLGFTLRLHVTTSDDPRTHNRPTVSVVACVLIEDKYSHRLRGIVLHLRDSPSGSIFKRIFETHPLYDPLQYPFPFPMVNQDGFTRYHTHRKMSYVGERLPRSREML